MRGIKKLKFAIGVPIMVLLTLIVCFGPGSHSWRYYNHFDFRWQYLVMIAVYYIIYMDLLLWVSCWLGLKLKTNRRAVMGAFIFLALWMIIPFVPIALKEIFYRGYIDDSFFKFFAYFSPIFPFAEMYFERGLTMFSYFLSVLCISVCYAFLRFSVMMKADKYLRK